MRRPVRSEASRNRLQQLVRAPLHRLRAVLHVEHRIGGRRGNGVDQRDLRLDRQRRTEKALADFLARLRRQRGQDRLRRAVDQRIAVAHRDGKSDAHADVAGGARDLGHLGRQIGQPLDAGVVHHDGAGAAERAARQRHRGGEIGIDRRQQRQIGNPGFQRLAGAAISRGRGDAGVVVGVGQRRQREQTPGRQASPRSTAAMRSPSIRMVWAPATGASAPGSTWAQCSSRIVITRQVGARDRKIAGSAAFVNWPAPLACARPSAAGTRG